METSVILETEQGGGPAASGSLPRFDWESFLIWRGLGTSYLGCVSRYATFARNGALFCTRPYNLIQ
jgi:hypothetical protein